jgi:hypothetical protein
MTIKDKIDKWWNEGLYEKLDEILVIVKDIQRKEAKFMATVEEQLQVILDTVVKVSGEIKKQIADLQALIGTVTPEAQAKIDAINAGLKELDDLNPDVPA